MVITALVKTNSGNEFVDAMIESIYNCVNQIVFINSDINWLGMYNKNDVKPVVESWRKEHDKDKKIYHYNCNVRNQKDQYNLGYSWAKSMFYPDWFLLIDTDEVFDSIGINKILKYTKKYHEYNAIGSNMYTYIKSPFYRVEPPEWCKPTILIRPILNEVLGIRGNYLKPRIIPNDLFFHHFTYVRKYEESIFKKINTTLAGDRDDVPQTKLVDIQKWRKNKWDKLPNAKNFHTTKYFEKSWHSIKEVSLFDLPESVRDKEIVFNYNM